MRSVGSLGARARRGRRSSWHFVATATARLVCLFRADDDDRLVVEGGDAVHDALRSGRGLAADDADRLELVDLLREREQRRDGTEWLAAEVEVEPRADDPMAARHQLAHHTDDRVIE